MRNRNLWVLLIVIILIAIVAALAVFMPQQKREAVPEATLVPKATQAPKPSSEADETSAESTPEIAPAYLLVTVGGVLYEPIPIYEEGSYTVRQGEEKENVIHVTPDSVAMESSSCDNQDCVQQGTVTLENMSKRVLGNMIICLPNEVTLELYTFDGLVEILTQMQ